MNKLIAIIIVSAFLAMGGWIALLLKNNKQLKSTVSDQAINIKSLRTGVVQYKNKFGEVYSRVIDQRVTIKELKQSKDSVISDLQMKIINANLNAKDVTQIGQTQYTIIRDTTVKYVGVNRQYDLSDAPHIYETIYVTDTTLKRDLRIFNKQTTFTHLKHETINPRRKFFLWRWFQKKQYLTYTDINNSNPFIIVDSALHIQIINEDGTPVSDKAKK